MELLSQTESCLVHYDEDRDIIFGSWVNCDNAEKLVSGIKQYKTDFEKILPEKIIWNMTELNYTIPKELQKWTVDFLEKPVSVHGINHKLAHVLSPDLYAAISVMDIYVEGNSPFTPRFFTHEKDALRWIEKPEIAPPLSGLEPKWKIDRFLEEQKARITIDMNLDELPQFLLEFRKMVKNQQFFIQNLQKFSLLRPREKFVLALIIKGKSNKEIAEITFTSIETVKTHRKNLLRKLECSNMAELMRYEVFL
jgi:DNA-binding CsgD family transcriptional regulator